MHSRVVLSSKNDDCLSINEEVLQMLPGESTTYLSADSVRCDNEEERQNYPIEFLHSLTPSGMHVLNLKVGSIVMLVRKISLRQKLCNGTRLEVTMLHQNSVQARLFHGPNAGNLVLIPAWHQVTQTCHHFGALPISSAVSILTRFRDKHLNLFTQTLFFAWSAVCGFL